MPQVIGRRDCGCGGLAVSSAGGDGRLTDLAARLAALDSKVAKLEASLIPVAKLDGDVSFYAVNKDFEKEQP